MRRSFYYVLMVVVLLRALTGTAMAAGLALPTMADQGMAPAKAPASAPAPTPVGATSELAPSGAAHSHPTEAPHSAPPAAAAQPGADQRNEPVHNHDHDHDHDHGLAPAKVTMASACQGVAGALDLCSHEHHHASSCSACEICHSAMLGAPAAVNLAATLQRTALPGVFAQFASAAVSQALKPPIA